MKNFSVRVTKKRKLISKTKKIKNTLRVTFLRKFVQKRCVSAQWRGFFKSAEKKYQFLKSGNPEKIKKIKFSLRVTKKQKLLRKNPLHCAETHLFWDSKNFISKISKNNF